MKNIITTVTIATAFAIPVAWAATMDQRAASNVADVDQWERMATTDACMNGDVPALGYYSTIPTDEKS